MEETVCQETQTPRAVSNSHGDLEKSVVRFPYTRGFIIIFTGFVWVLENLESPGILLRHFPGLEGPGKRSWVLESSGNLFNSAKKYEVYGEQ